ncbi:MAG TPA: hypothetical protein VGI57_08645 [Usitatibacter sp.]|jgi:hypothetical protein
MARLASARWLAHSSVLACIVFLAMPVRADAQVPCRNFRSVADCARLSASKPTQLAIPLKDADAVTGEAVHIETIIVHPDPEDLPRPTVDKWTRFVRALGPAKVARTATETRLDDGSRMICYSPCDTSCCEALSDGEDRVVRHPSGTFQ